MADASAELDLRGLKCPLPVLKARKAIKGVGVGVELTLLVTDPGAPADLKHFCEISGHTLVASEDANDHVRIILRRES